MVTASTMSGTVRHRAISAGVLVDQAVVDLAGLLVARVCRGDQLAGERCPDLAGNLDRAAHVVSPPPVSWPTMASGRASGVS
jgi:hypothetical protein